MKTKIFLSMLALFACAATSSAQKITREQADEIVINYVKSEVEQLNPKFHLYLYAYGNTPSAEGFALTTSAGETVKAKYACWVYVVNRLFCCPTLVPIPPMHRYLFVKEDNGSLLDVVTNNDVMLDLNSWTEIDLPTGIVNPKESNKFLYPNPVDDWLTVPCNGENTRVEIYDLKGARLLAETLSGKDVCQLNVSFLSTGIYMVNIEGETYKIVKK